MLSLEVISLPARRLRSLATRKIRHAPEDVRLGSIRESIPFNLRLAQNACFAAFAKATGDADLRPGWYTLLQVLHDNPGSSATALSRTTGRDKSTLTPLLTQLEEHGLIVRRTTAHDKRMQSVDLTRAGRERLRRLAQHAVRHDRALDKIVGPAYKPEFLAALRRIIDAFDARAGL
jgi:DNA-binding MarR family transcriptional regulator